MTKAQMFLQAANPNSEGKTRLWLYSELEVLYPGVEFQTNNGGDWNRSDGVLKDYIIHREKRGVKCIGIRLDGYKDTSIEKRIKPSISKAIKNQRCKVLDVGGKYIECDHKDGRYTPEIYGDIEDQNTDDFQALHRNVNLAKRTHCNGCKITDKRYNAKKLGYSVGWTDGDENYRGFCNGCYWFDPVDFNSKISKHFIKEFKVIQ
jgi:hypothetical protein